MSKIIVLNSKGGVGKSTTSTQILAPFLYIKNGQNDKVNLIEFDDENEDSLSFENSDILIPKRVKIEGNDLDSALTDNVLDFDDVVLDIGGNKTTTYVIDSLVDSGIINAFDLIVIPLTDGEQDALNAINVYKKIRQNNEDSKIIFALSRVNNSYDLEMQFLDFFGDAKGRLDDRVGLIEQVAEQDRNIIKIVDSDVIKFSRVFGVTAFELSQKDIQELKEKQKESLKAKDKEKSKKIAYRLTILNKAIRYKDEVLKECFKAIQEVTE